MVHQRRDLEDDAVFDGNAQEEYAMRKRRGRRRRSLQHI